MFHVSGVTACASRSLSPDCDLIDLFERLRHDPFPWLLDSALPSHRLGRFSFAGSDPYLVLKAWGTTVAVECRRAVRPGLVRGRVVVEADPFEVLRSSLPRLRARTTPSDVDVPFWGGAVGYLGYELAERIEGIDLVAADDLGLPDLYVLFVDRLVSFDSSTASFRVHALGFAESLDQAEQRAHTAADSLVRRLSTPRPSRAAAPEGSPSLSASGSFDSSTHAKAVDTAKEEIAAGNAYQVCLSQRLEQPWTGEPWSLYGRLRASNPAPFAAYLELPEVAIVGSSPERFLRLSSDGFVESRPIKGTLARAAEPEMDQVHFARLASSAKDRAENLMIVDLVRNDLGRVCETGSVTVPELMVIEAYASVFQMVSTVNGRLRSDHDAVDLIRASFPPGSMTGAPKIAAMRIIDRLEPVRRGIYSGAIGYFDVRGGLDLCVVIRTILVANGRAYVQAGGGIVADSDPLDEYRESLDKARLLMEALGFSGR